MTFVFSKSQVNSDLEMAKLVFFSPGNWVIHLLISKKRKGQTRDNEIVHHEELF